MEVKSVKYPAAPNQSDYCDFISNSAYKSEKLVIRSSDAHVWKHENAPVVFHSRTSRRSCCDVRGTEAPSAAHVSDQQKAFILIIVMLIPLLQILIPVLRIPIPVLRFLIPVLRFPITALRILISVLRFPIPVPRILIPLLRIPILVLTLPYTYNASVSFLK